MKPLHVALVHRGQAYRYTRVDGQFAYEIPEFTWEHVEVDKAVQGLDVNQWEGRFDLVWLDPGKYSYPHILSPKPALHRVPVIYWSLYPTLTPGHLANERLRAQCNANLVLLDHDNLSNWRGLGRPVRRLAYSVNEHYYYDRGLERDIDVNFACYPEYSHERPALDAWLAEHCRQRGWTYASGCHYVGLDYAVLMARSKVVVHLLRTPQTRPPRIFDAAASGTALLSNPMPVVSGEHWQPGVQYGVFREPHSETCAGERHPPQREMNDRTCAELAQGLDWMLAGEHWRTVAENAKAYVLACHTWARRATELRQIIHEELGL